MNVDKQIGLKDKKIKTLLRRGGRKGARKVFFMLLKRAIRQ